MGEYAAHLDHVQSQVHGGHGRGHGRGSVPLQQWDARRAMRSLVGPRRASVDHQNRLRTRCHILLLS